ncbi:MAG: tetratricopeptide repeat protein [Pseudomonadota bacterium]
MKNIFSPILTSIAPIALSASLMLTGCAGLKPVTAVPADEAHQASDAAHAALDAEKTLNGITPPSSEDQLPAVELTDEIFYKLLTAEIAYQRGNWQAAYITILSVAQQTRDPRLARRASEIALSVKQPGEAMTAIRLWRELAPNSNEATQYYLGFMVMNNNLAEIQRVFSEKLASATPKQYGVTMLQAQRLLSRARDKNAAFDTLEALVEPYKSTYEAHLALAQGSYSRGDNQRAISEAQTALEQRPDSQLAILTIAQASSQPDAAKAMSSFLAKNPAARDVRLAYASILIDLKQLDKATAEFEHLLRDKPDDVGVMYTLGVLAMESKHTKLAEKYFNDYLGVLEANPAEERDPTPALINLAQIASDRKDDKAALDWLSKVESYDGRNAAYLNVQIRRAQIIAKSGKLAEARQFLKEVQASSDDDKIQLIQAEAQLLREAKQPLEAGRLLEDAIQHFPNNPDLLYDYAMIAESQQKVSEMEASLRKVMELAPNNQHAYNALGYALAERNIRLDEALTLIEKALQLAPDDPFILDSLGWVKFRLAKPEEAEQALRRAYTLRPDAEIAVHLGEVLWSQGQKDNARKFWREAKAKDPDNEVLKSTLQRLNAKP